jgi:uncharacterized protein (DUF58 family)
MLWSGQRRVAQASRGTTIAIEAEVRNRDSLAAKYVKLRAIASSQLDVHIEPPAGEVPASGRLQVKVVVHAPRVGQHGVHGLALEVHGASGLFEVPLTFANPYGVEVVPGPLAAALMDPRGGRSHLVAASGKPGRRRGEGADLRELREHQPGDPFRRIAWKASARRGRLLVREFEREERDVVWVVLDVTVDLWAGPRGRAPLDLALDEAAAVVARHLSRGDRTGLLLTSTGHRVVVPPDRGMAQAQRIQRALTLGAGSYDAHRSDLDESDVAVRVLEHLRPLDSRALADVRRNDLDKLASRADAARSRAPFSPPLPNARTPRERTLRRYLASFGVEAPPKTDPNRRDADLALVDALGQIARTKPRASLVHVIAPAPDDPDGVALGDAVRRLRRGSATVVWATPNVAPSLEPPWEEPPPPAGEDEDLFSPGETPKPPPQALPLGETPKPAQQALPSGRGKARSAFSEIAPIVSEAVKLRVETANARREAGLQRLGVRLAKRARPSASVSRAPLAEEPDTSGGAEEPAEEPAEDVARVSPA